MLVVFSRSHLGNSCLDAVTIIVFRAHVAPSDAKGDLAIGNFQSKISFHIFILQKSFRSKRQSNSDEQYNDIFCFEVEPKYEKLYQMWIKVSKFFEVYYAISQKLLV